MKKLFALITFAAVLNFSYAPTVFAQDGTEETTEVAADDAAEGTEAAGEEMTTEAEEPTAEADDSMEVSDAEVEEAPASFHQTLKKYFIDGGAGFMGIVLVVLIIGLALCIERIIYLSLATGNSEKLLGEIENGLNSGGVEAAKEVCRNTKGPVASIFYQGLNRKDEGLDMVEKSIVSYGSVQMGMLEKGLSWISLCIALAPMLGFMGTVIGMIGAFDAIEAAGDISPSLVAGGIKVALLTTVFGLVVAIILQVFYNYLIAKVDSLVNDMEESSISFMDILIKSGK